MTPTPQPIREYHHVDDATFRNDIVTQYHPAVMRGYVKHWPVVQHARESPEAVCRYLMGLDSGNDVDVLLLPPEAKGRVFYQPDLAAHIPEARRGLLGDFSPQHEQEIREWLARRIQG